MPGSYPIELLGLPPMASLRIATIRAKEPPHQFPLQFLGKLVSREAEMVLLVPTNQQLALGPIASGANDQGGIPRIFAFLTKYNPSDSMPARKPRLAEGHAGLGPSHILPSARSDVNSESYCPVWVVPRGGHSALAVIECIGPDGGDSRCGVRRSH